MKSSPQKMTDGTCPICGRVHTTSACRNEEPRLTSSEKKMSHERKYVVVGYYPGLCIDSAKDAELRRILRRKIFCDNVDTIRMRRELWVEVDCLTAAQNTANRIRNFGFGAQYQKSYVPRRLA